MNIALLLAGGNGTRMHQDIPKQFLNVYDKPIIIYTMQAFQNHPDIDEIAVVCIDGWHEILQAYAKQFNITKLKKIISGAENGQGSIRNGIYALAEDHKTDDIVLIHDAIRPMVSSDIISDCIVKCRAYGNAIATVPCAEAMLHTQDDITSKMSIDRTKLKRTQTPQGFRLGDIVLVHKEALAKGITNSVASCTLYIELGRNVFFSMGSEKNIKVTTVDDLDIFKALLKVHNSDWIK